jgi:uncharacterized delta-60 repeat protein
MTASRRALIVVGVLAAVALGLPWGGAVPTASAQAIQVTSATPPSAEQGTFSLPVTIKGNGFKKGAKAKFYKGGTTDPDGISVSSTRFIDSTQLVATIDVADTAAVSGFDIVVQNTDGRTGKGTELFKVTEKIDPCTLPDPVPTGGFCFNSANGCLDATFGNGTGRVIGPRHMQIGTLGRGPSLAIQNIDGQAKIIGIGASYDVCANNAQRVWAVARYLPDGTLDPTFGSGGVARRSFSTTGFGNVANSVAIQPDNKIVVVGMSPSNKGGLPTIVRFNANGAIDPTFGSGGVVVLTTPGKSPSGNLYTVAVQSDGRIVAAGAAAYTPGYMVRLNPNGSVDTSFGAYGGPSAIFTALRIQRFGSEERVVIAGRAAPGRATIWRFTSSGAPDATFGGSGMVVASFPSQDCQYCSQDFNDLIIDSSNFIVAVGDAGYWPPSGLYQLNQ